MEITTVGVTGAGQMGGGIAQVFAQVGLTVHLHDVSEAALQRAQRGIRQSLDTLAEKGKLQGSPDAVISRIHLTTSLDPFQAAACVVEAAPEQVELKRSIFTSLDAVTLPSAILASNTSSIAIATLADATRRPAQVIGMHFMNPVPRMPCVEVIRARATSDATFAITSALVARLGKTMVVSQDRAGFIVNRILMPMINEAAHAFAEGVATRDDIDTAMKLSCNFPMGPLALADFIGLDTVVAILEVMQEGLAGAHYAPSPLLREYVAKGWTGRKGQRGFYEYASARTPPFRAAKGAIS
ncbi:MAG: 3-hydroxybutyryl-CoA dehydrogenase [Deltaproteobacteria bacterium]|nr:3-hydroxybutyryl-CoA dehydrogenase [Deltaproteobacteria bacterium]